MSWQHMKHAPKDGTPILIYYWTCPTEEGDIAVLRWLEEYQDEDIWVHPHAMNAVVWGTSCEAWMPLPLRPTWCTPQPPRSLLLPHM